MSQTFYCTLPIFLLYPYMHSVDERVCRRRNLLPGQQRLFTRESSPSLVTDGHHDDKKIRLFINHMDIRVQRI
jgi:hypothetical protein